MSQTPPSKTSTAESEERKVALTLANLQTALEVAQSAAGLSNVPFISIVIGAASTLLSVIQTTRTNKKDCEALAKHTDTLVTAISKLQSGSDEKDIDEDLRAQLEVLKRSLVKTNEKMLEIAAHGRLKRIWTSTVDKEDIQGLKDGLVSAIQDFQLQLDISESLLGSVRHKEVMGELKRINPLVPEPQESFLYSEPPAAPEIFYGRDDYVAEAVSIILTKAPARLAILGPGGMGKTSVAIAILHDFKIKGEFGHARYFVPCESASTAEILLNTLIKVLGMQNSGQNSLRNMLVFLNAAGALLLVLDNFETPWDGEKKGEVEELLGHLGSITTLTLLITMRGTVYPMKPKWTKPGLRLLPVLDSMSAKLAYLDICPVDDSSLDTLLKEIDYIPLAITLTAKVAESDSLSPSEMLTKWRTHHTAVLSAGSPTRLSNVDMSISLSIKSQLIQKQPEALHLLALVCTLPDGVFQGQWPSIRSLFQKEDQAEQAAQTLRQAALAYKDHTHELHILSPIYYYVQKNHKMSQRDYQKLRKLYFDFAAHGEGYHHGKKDMAKLLTEESVNITSILLDSNITGDTEEMINASLTFSIFLYYTYPSCDVLLHALEHMTGETPPVVKGVFLGWLGEMYQVLGQDDKATVQLELAKQEFEIIGDKMRWAQSLRSLGDIARKHGQYEDATAQLQTANQIFESIGDRLGAAQCQRSLGNIARMHGQYDKATSQLQAAQHEFLSLGHDPGVAQCQLSLGDVAQRLGQYESAIAQLKAAKEQFERIDDKFGEAQCQRLLGHIYFAIGQYDDATVQYTATKKYYDSIGNKPGATQCQQSLDGIALIHCPSNEVTVQLQAVRKYLESIGTPHGAAQHQQILGEIDCILGQYGKATAQLQETSQ